jgi:predicted nucleotidyltransferase component of viral defense system
MNNYQDLLAIAAEESRTKGVDMNTALKEILHYDILYALSESKLKQDLVFQGGTALRLCYKGNRYSEDLDFVCGKEDTMEKMDDMKRILTETIEQRYNLEMKFKEPKPIRFEGKELQVMRWMAVIHVPRENPAQPQKQKIKIEIADVPSHDNEAQLVQRHYNDLAPGYDNIMLRVATLREIMADKILAVAGRPAIKSRDIWDLHWLNHKNIPVDLDMIRKKLVDYKEDGVFEGNLEGRINEMLAPGYAKVFYDEMSRFLDQRTRTQINDAPNYSQGLIKSVSRNLEEALTGLKRGVKVLGGDELTL